MRRIRLVTNEFPNLKDKLNHNKGGYVEPTKCDIRESNQRPPSSEPDITPLGQSEFKRHLGAEQHSAE